MYFERKNVLISADTCRILYSFSLKLASTRNSAYGLDCCIEVVENVTYFDTSLLSHSSYTERKGRICVLVTSHGGFLIDSLCDLFSQTKHEEGSLKMCNVLYLQKKPTHC